MTFMLRSGLACLGKQILFRPRAVVEVGTNVIKQMVCHVTNPPQANGASGERDGRQAPLSPAASRHRA